jgi:hypothetical protein
LKLRQHDSGKREPNAIVVALKLDRYDAAISGDCAGAEPFGYKLGRVFSIAAF